MSDFIDNLNELILAAPPPPAEQPTTFTVEPWCLDGVADIWYAGFTRQCLHGSLTPYVKIPYVASGLPGDTREGAERINEWVTKGVIQNGDTICGFSLGVQTISLYLSRHVPPEGIKFMLCGSTFWRNQDFLDNGNYWLLGTGGIPWDIKNEVTMIVREFDGWSDVPDVTDAPGYDLAMRISRDGRYTQHDYRNADLVNKANVVDIRGNITAILVPTQWLPEYASESDREAINAAYSGPRPTPEQRAMASEEQA